MTTQIPAPEQIPPGPPRVLRRPTQGRVFGGVAGGVARWLDIDPVIVRVVLVVLALFGGSGLIIYLVGWLFIPEDGASASEADHLIDQVRQPQSTSRTVLIVVAAVVGAIILANIVGGFWWAGGWGFGGGGALLLILAVVGLIIYLAQRPTAPPQVPPTAGFPVVGEQPTVQQTGYAYGGSGQYPGYTAPPPPPAPRPRSYLGLATLSMAVAAMGALTALAVGGVADIPAVAVMATGLTIVGIGLVIGAFLGRARWLLALAIPLLVVTAVAASVPRSLDDRVFNGVGDRTWRPVDVATTAEPFELGVGRATLDLRSLELPATPAATVAVTSSVGIGDLRVIVPDGVSVQVDARAGVGRVAVQGLAERDGDDVVVTGTMPGSTTGPVVLLTVSVGLGNVEVSRA